MRATRQKMPATAIGELDAGDRRHQKLAGVRVAERAPGPAQRIRLLEDRGVTAQRPPGRCRSEAKLFTGLAGNSLGALEPERDINRPPPVEHPRQLSRPAPAPGHPLDLARPS